MIGSSAALEQLRAVTGDHIQLRHMDMGIDKPRQDQPPAQIVNNRTTRQPMPQGGPIANGRDQAIFNDHQAVFDITKRAIAIRRVIGQSEETSLKGPDTAVTAHCPRLRFALQT